MFSVRRGKKRKENTLQQEKPLVSRERKRVYVRKSKRGREKKREREKRRRKRRVTTDRDDS